MKHKIKIGLREDGVGYVTLDGFDVETVAFAVTAEAGEAAEVTLVLRPIELELDIETPGKLLTMVRKVVDTTSEPETL
jgi:hypothetical protein